MRTRQLTGFLVFGAVALAPVMAGAGVNIQIGIPLPQVQLQVPFVISTAPELVVLPGTNVYVAPNLDDDLYFEGGYWWRPYQGRWYRSRAYNSGWEVYSSVPSFYVDINSGWRDEYRNHRWGGQPWQYERMPHDRVEQNWGTWQSTDYWRSNRSWGVQGYNPPPRGRGPQGPSHYQQRNDRYEPGRDHGGSYNQPRNDRYEPARDHGGSYNKKPKPEKGHGHDDHRR